ncbi:MAG TPA: UrcA family protein [Rhizomicrobium sp.]|jgi:UrcA family protein|nr:UrcA family protein [Rhizomicrobium sp.]
MSVRSSLTPIRLALLASALGMVLAAPSALAQDVGRYGDTTYNNNSTSESVTVTAPNITRERDLPGLPGKMTLSQEVSYHDLDLTTRDGDRALRERVRDTARDVCNQLREQYPLHEQPLATKCYEGALKDAMLRADAAIRDARDSDYYRARYSHE